MSVETPRPRLPLEPEEYPLYRPPRRIGCSALTIITLLLVMVFALLLWRVTPPMAKAITSIPQSIFSPNDDGEADGTPVPVGFATQTAIAQPTSPPPPPPTPVIEYVQLANTEGKRGFRMRAEPRTNSKEVVNVGEGAKFMVVGPNVASSEGEWRHVELPGDGRKGYVLAKYLIPSTAP